MKNTIKMSGFALIAAITLSAVLLMAGCEDPEPYLAEPIGSEFEVENLYQAEGSVTAVKITPKYDYTSKGEITIWYEGIEGMSYPKSTEVPVESKGGKYAVTFDVAEIEGFKAATGLTAGTLLISPLMTSVDDFKTWLTAQAQNATQGAYVVKLNITGLSGASDTANSLGSVFKANGNKYVSLDLSGSTFATNKIPNEAFKECSTLQGIIIPDTVTEIGTEAFYKTGLNSVTIGKGVIIIGSSAFRDTYLIDGVTIPGNVTTIGDNAFNTARLDSVTLEEGVKTIGAYAFYFCQAITSITIPNSVTSIGGSAFYGCIRIASVTLGTSLTSIGAQAFRDCALTEISLPDSLTFIGSSAFYSTRITSITIPAAVNDIAASAFGGSNITTITVAPGNTAFVAEDGVLYNTSKTVLHTYLPRKTGTSFIIPNTVTEVNVNAFYGVVSLTSVTIPSSVTKIGIQAFQSTGLVSVTFQGTIAAGTSPNFNIPSNAFFGDLRAKFYATNSTDGTPGTYTTTSPASTSSVWTKS